MSRHPFDLTLMHQFFHISEEGAQETLYSFPGEELLHEDVMKRILSVNLEAFCATGKELPVSFLSNAFFSLPATVLYLAARYNKLVDFSLTHFDFQAEPRPNHIHSAFRWKRVEWIDLPDGPTRRTILEEGLIRLFQQTLLPVLESVAAASGTKTNLSWSQYGGRMQYVADYIQRTESDPSIIRRFNEDLLTLRSLDASIFQCRRNPFVHTPRYIDNPYEKPYPLMIRSSCCYYYQRESGTMCYTCPKLTPEQREARKQEIQSSTV